jgi:nitroreductase
MNPVKGEQLLTQLNWRYATKKFDPRRKILADDWAALETALILSPSSYGLQP